MCVILEMTGQGCSMEDRIFKVSSEMNRPVCNRAASYMSQGLTWPIE